MDYIHYLRSMVGTKPVIIVTAVVVVTNAEGELLMQRRADGSSWGLVGGFMELGETVEEAARREVFEETGLTIGELTLFGVFSSEHVYSSGDEAQVISVVYLTDYVGGELSLDEVEGLELRYFALGALPELLFAPNIPILEAIQERFGKR